MFGFSGKQATALFESAKSDNNVQQVATELRSFADAFDNDEDLMMELMSPLIRGEQFVPKLQELFPQLNISSKQAQELITELVTTRGAGKLGKILEDYDQLSQWDRREITANVTSAQPLSDEQRRRLKEALQRSIGSGEQLVLNEQVDESLLGGLKVDLGDRAIDLSLASRLGDVDRELRTQ